MYTANRSPRRTETVQNRLSFLLLLFLLLLLRVQTRRTTTSHSFAFPTRLLQLFRIHSRLIHKHAHIRHVIVLCEPNTGNCARREPSNRVKHAADAF